MTGSDVQPAELTQAAEEHRRRVERIRGLVANNLPLGDALYAALLPDPDNPQLRPAGYVVELITRELDLRGI